MGMNVQRESMATPIVALMLVLLLPKYLPVFGTVIHQSSDADLLAFSLNLEYLEAEFFLHGALGYGLDKVAPQLTKGGPPPIGATKANLDDLTRDVILQIGLQELGHVRTIHKTVKGFPRPLLNLSSQLFASLINAAFGREIRPSFDPYRNSLNFLIASYAISYAGPTVYVGDNPNLTGITFKKVVAGLLGVEAGQDAVIRALLYERREMRVMPYNITVAEFTNRISELGNRLGRGGVKSEGLVVPIALGTEGRVSGNVLSADQNSLSYGRTPIEILRIFYGSGDERKPGGFFPNGANGKIARSYLSLPA
ncbi:ferritin-like catalase Nec2 [Humulus lupulus]|uniref:ferritin-like catalase Nec2 n=1 Tax=Humulus lupulus TaxID=3486 RepID=UPI002B4007D8|nr:ferritin-like catalase Nec2 [Humulus lupulus]